MNPQRSRFFVPKTAVSGTICFPPHGATLFTANSLFQMNSRPRVQVIGPRAGTWLSFHGVPVQILARAEDTGGTYMISRGTAAPGDGAPPHVHSFDEGFYVLRGEMTFTAGNQVVTASDGTFVNIPGGVAHFVKNASDSEAEVLVIGAPAGFDGFQIAVSEAAPGPDGPFAPAPADLQARMERASAEFGINLHPAPALFEVDPRLTVRPPGSGEPIAAVGDLYNFLATSEHTSGRYAIWHATIHPGGGPPPHVHTREHEAFYILCGNLSAFDQGERVVVGPGSLIILPKDSLHWFKNETDEPVEMIILIAPGGGEEMFRQFGTPWPSAERPPLPTPEEIARLITVAPNFGVELHLPGGH
jgi:quercetin dioxygenase-like cupin family protein